jgi:penicillin-binding protein 1A
MANMLSDVINSGTAWKARSAGFTLPAGGKTGTTNDYRDVWFVGFTPRVVTGVWIGFDQPTTIIPNGYAGELAVPLWARVMKVATDGDEPKWLDRPPGVVAVSVCRVSGMLPSEGCSSVEVMRSDGTIQERNMVYTEYFARGTAPTHVCEEHPTRSWYQRVTEVFGAAGPQPARDTDLGMPAPPAASAQTGAADAAPAPVVVAAPTESAQVQEEEKPRKRGFWGRLFGRRDKEADQKQPQPR